MNNRPVRLVRRTLITTFVLCTTGLGDASDGPTASEILSRRGLLRRRTQFVLPGESELSQGLRTLKSQQRRLSRAEQAEITHQRELRVARDRIRRLTLARRAQNRKLASARSAKRQNRLIAKINEITDSLNLLVAFVDEDRQGAQLRAKSGIARREYIAQIVRLRTVVDDTRASYAELATTADVTAALTAITESEGRSHTLGPSDPFTTNTAKFVQYEQTVVSDAVPLRQAGSVYYVDVSVNGSDPTPMVFDTGASLVSLPFELAAELGVALPSDATIIPMTIADGSVIQAKRMVLDSVRVGTFEVRHVACVVLPSGLSNPPTLLGGSYLRNFLFGIDPKTSSLRLTKIDLKKGSRARR